MQTTSKSAEIKLIRLFDAPIQVVWDAWSNLEQITQWWGPRGFSITTESRDLRPGGVWKYTMHGPGGVEFLNTGKYIEIEEKKKLVYDQGGGNDQKPLFRSTVTFRDLGDKTEMDMTMAFPTAESAERTAGFIKQAGGDTTWDRLAELVNEKHVRKTSFVISRSFPASKEVLYQMWTDPQEFCKWLAPTGFEMKFIRCDIKTGGSGFYCLRQIGNESVKMYGRSEYLELRKPDLYVGLQQFCDADEKVARHPMAATWPETIRTTVVFAEEGPEQSRLTLTWEPAGECPPEDVQTFVAGRGQTTVGWTGSFDKLEELLTKK